MKMLLRVCAIVLACATIPSPIRAQIEAKCGDVIETEFTENFQEINLLIGLEPGDAILVQGKTVSRKLGFRIFVFGPTNLEIANSGDGNPTSSDYSFPAVDTGTLPAHGKYRIVLTNKNWWRDTMGVGIATVEISCTLKDGTVINPGDTAQSAVTTPASSAAQPVSVPTNGFPGLAPVDFSKATKLKLPRSGEIEGEITPEGGEVLGFTFDAAEQQVFDLSFTRISGNLNLGLVVLSGDNKVYFQTSLVASSTLNTQFALPAGKYTLGIFKIDLVTPATPETTEFAITLK
jgi:hypothetical protein